MSYQYLLDTNILLELIKHPQGLIFYKIQTVGESRVCTSIIVAAELKFGIENKTSSEIIPKADHRCY